ncbi:MAG: cyclic nucleotide-binding domain-containing protein [Pseudomonadota bacterium]
MTPLEILAEDMRANGVNPDEALCSNSKQKCSIKRVRTGTCLYSQHHIGEGWLFLTNGVAASRQTHPDGGWSIARFFERGQFCANLTSAWTKEYTPDDLVAITDIEGVEFPDAFFREEFLRGGRLGEYIRLKSIETLCFDKEVICIKTINDTEARYRFLEERHDSVVAKALQKHIAAFLGITPQGLSRFLKARRGV